jgi:aminoglycoside phosphotransferase (APT) family kinase protein
MATRLAHFVASRVGVPAEAVRVETPRRLAGGSSRETWRIGLEIERDGSHEAFDLVLRRDPPGRVGDFGEREVEFGLLQAAAEAGVPVPRVHWSSADPQVLGAPFLLMDRVPGEALPRRLLREPRYAKVRRTMTGELGEILARIHSIDVADPRLRGLCTPTAGAPPARSEMERMGASLRELSVELHPVLDLAERWLLERAPSRERRALVHGDFRIGNVMFDEEGVRAVLDWELAHVGDPLEDLGWLCTRAWRYGNDTLPVGGIGTREELVSAYEAASGTQVDPHALRFWEAFGNFKLALVFILQARTYLDGKVPSIDLASLGRRIAEPEAELVRFMKEAS